ncbi:protein decapping 5 [Sesamum alatum]|uniref:Protein decapping 5 n=1 Tax=Sesamum alatum TaxID=300844 RepID=A0AAE1Y4W3_9LAMI|nr:protein decapping 5 [Sesamum alatum]
MTSLVAQMQPKNLHHQTKRTSFFGFVLVQLPNMFHLQLASKWGAVLLVAAAAAAVLLATRAADVVRRRSPVSHYPRPTPPPTSLLTAPSGSLADHGSHCAQMGLPGPTFQSGLPLYQPGGNLNSWGPSPPNANGNGLAMPMYWQGFYGTPNGLSQLPQQSLLRPPPGLSVPPSMQQMQFSGFNSSLPTAGSSLPTANLPDYHFSLVSSSTGSSSLTSTLPA